MEDFEIVARNRWIEEQSRLAKRAGRHAEWEVAGLYWWAVAFWSPSERMKLGVRTNAGRFMRDVRR
jgi:hypothetical protein